MLKTVISKANLKKLFILIVIGIVANLIFVLYKSDPSLIEYLGKLQFYHFGIIIIFIILYWAGHAFRIVIWTRFLKSPLSFGDGYHIAAYTDLGAAVTPTLIGGGPVKLGLLIQKGLSTGKSGFLTVLGGTEDILMYVLAIFLIVFYAHDSADRIVSATLGSIHDHWWKIILGLFLIYLVRKVMSRFPSLQLRNLIPLRYKKIYVKFVNQTKVALVEMIGCINLIWKDGKLRFLLSFSVLLIQWILKFSILIILLDAFGLRLDTISTHLNQWIVYLSMMIVPTPGAAGGAETLFYFVFSEIIPESLLPIVITLWRFGTYYLFLILAVILLQVQLWRTMD